MAQRDEIARLEAMHAENPDGRVFAHLAEAYRKKGELERAREVLQSGLERHPQYASAHVVMGRVLLDLGESGAAEDAFRRVLELDPHNMVALRARGDIAHAEGRLEDALQHYRELISLDPSDDQIVLRVAELEMGRPLTPVEGVAGEATSPPDAGQASADYGEVSLPGPGDAPMGVEPAADWGVDLASASPSASGGPAAEPEPEELDMGIGGLLEPTDLGGSVAGDAERPAEWAPGPQPEPEETREVEPAPAADAGHGLESLDEAIEGFAAAEPLAPELDALAGLGAFEPSGETEPDALVDLLEAADAFSLPTLDDATRNDAPAAGAEDELALPGFDEIAADATPVPGAEAVPPADAVPPAEPESEAEAGTLAELAPPAAEPPAAEISAGRAEAAAFDNLWADDRDGGAAELPEGPELVTETIGDLYAQQGLTDRAVEVYEKLLATRPDDSALRAKLESARQGAAADTGPVTAAPVEAEAAELPAAEAPELPPEASALPAEPPVPSGADDLPLLPWEGGPEDTADVVSADELGLEPIGGGDIGGPEPPTEAQPDEPASWLGLEPIGAGVARESEETAAVDTSLISDEAAPGAEAQPSEPDGIEHVEAAWTGGAGASADVESPFGWAEPDAAPDEGTIGDYLDGLIGFMPEPTDRAAEPQAPVAPDQPQAASESAPPAAPPAAQDTSAPTTPIDDIDALFGDIPEPAPPEMPPAPAAATTPPPDAEADVEAGGTTQGFDDIDALFADVPAASPAPPEPPAAQAPPPPAEPHAAQAAPTPSPEPQAEQAPVQAGPEPLSEPISQPAGAPADDATTEAAAAGFEWDPFAELAEPDTEPAAAASAPDAGAGSAPSEAQEPAEDEDDDEDIDMFRAWLQSLKR